VLLLSGSLLLLLSSLLLSLLSSLLLSLVLLLVASLLELAASCTPLPTGPAPAAQQQQQQQNRGGVKSTPTLGVSSTGQVQVCTQVQCAAMLQRARHKFTQAQIRLAT
jgi:hypothetical protein